MEQTAARSAGIIWVLALLTAFGPMSIDMYLPSLPTIGDELQASAGDVQLTLSAFFVGSALGQLFYGPLSDRYGRRPVLISGILLYITTSALCATSKSVDQLVAYRFLHALGSGAGMAIARSVVRDLYDREGVARALSLMMLVMGVAPMLAPLIGGQILILWGWRAIFWLLAGFGCLCLIAVLARLPESLPVERRRHGRLGDMLAGFVSILRNRMAFGCILAGGFGFAGMFAYISGTPFVYIRYFGVSAEHYGFLFGLNIVGMMAWAAINARLVTRWSAIGMMRAGVLQNAGGGLLLLAAGSTGAFGLIGIVVPLFIYVSAQNLVAANAMARASEPFPDRAGAVAALFGTLQFAFGAVAGVAVGQFHDGTPLPMAAVIAVCGLLSLSAYLWAGHGSPQST